MPWALRMSADTWQFLRSARCLEQPQTGFVRQLDHTRFSHVSGPPRERGMTWSRLPSSGRSNAPVYWQRLPSRSRMVWAQNFGPVLPQVSNGDRFHG
jgi:hypothetical protein